MQVMQITKEYIHAQTQIMQIMHINIKAQHVHTLTHTKKIYDVHHVDISLNALLLFFYI